ncbi:MAG: penicillin-binding protein activator [Rickettsiales bacterium]
MTNRYRIWKTVFAGLSIAGLLTSCMAPPPPNHGTQKSPNISRELAAGANKVISPYASAVSGSGEDYAMIAAQKVVKVALLLPLTGRNADLGRALQDAATVSLFDKYARLSLSSQTVRVELLPKDTGDTPEQATQAMADAVASGAEFVIGPLFADATAAAAPIARAKNINVLSFSNTRTQASPGTYMFGFSPTEQTERVVSYAIQNGKSRIAVLAPNSALGDMVLAAARETAEKNGQKLFVEAKYTVQGAGIDTALNSMVTAGKQPQFDAILIPEGGASLDTIMRGLSSRGVKPGNMKFLGTGLWDDADLLRRVNLDSAWFASSSPILTSQFENRFRTTYNYAPPRIASLAYDAVALAVTLATSGRPYDAVNLTTPSGFSGPANGIFRLRANGMVQRGLAVMEVHGGERKIISRPPNGF